ncbi:MAG: type II secretion system F family protein [Haloarculaceae archaeon]
MTTDRAARSTGALGSLDRGLYALFGRNADRRRHERDRQRYRATAMPVAFDVYLARVYGLSWVVGVALAAATALSVSALSAGTVAAVGALVRAFVPVLGRVALPTIPWSAAALALGALVGVTGKYVAVRVGGLYLGLLARARRATIERSLPGAVRYLRALSSGSHDRRAMLRKVTEQAAYAETGVAFRTVLNRATLTGSLDAGLRSVARDTPSATLSAFLLKFREHGNQGEDALGEYLRMESRMLSNRQERQRQRARDFLELVAELFVVTLVVPALFVVVLTVLSVLAPGLSATVSTPLGPVTLRALAVYASAAFVVGVGAVAAALVASIRPPDQAPPAHARPAGFRALILSAGLNPASAATVCFVPVASLGAGLLALGYRPANALVLSYVAFGLPVGLVAVRRARLDDAKDRQLKDFVHAVAGHVTLGQPFGRAVATVAREGHLGELQADVDDLAFTLGLATGTDDGDARSQALSGFVDAVGTPLAEQTMGLVTGALDAGSETDAVFETLQTEVGALHEAKKSLRSSMLVYVAVGWTTALLVVGIMVAVQGYVLDGFTQLSTVSRASGGLAIDPDAVVPARDGWRFYLVTQSTMLACGWFAGMANRGRYEALLHSAVLLGVAYVAFVGVGAI